MRRDTHRLRKSTFHKIANRLGGVSAGNLLEVAVRTVRSVAQGVIGTAIIQGFLSAVGFLIAGVPFAIALGVLSFGTAMLQIGTWLVWIPVATWLFHQGEIGWAVFTSVLGIIINVLDNVIKPLLIGRGAGVPIWGHLYRCDWGFVDDGVHRHLHRPTSHGRRLFR
jgi:predicted PurR-regulated permease PerM